MGVEAIECGLDYPRRVGREWRLRAEPGFLMFNLTSACAGETEADAQGEV